MRLLHPHLALSLQLLVLLLLLPSISADCVPEFGLCVTNRDCCQNDDDILTCVTGDWEYTTDSTCLSQRSERLDALGREEKLSAVLMYYRALGAKSDKSPDQVEALAKKYTHSFAQLAKRLEKKYGVEFDLDRMMREEEAEREEKLSAVRMYYRALGAKSDGSPDQVEALAKKYTHSFAQLVKRLEKKYGVAFDLDRMVKGKEKDL